MQYSVSFIKAVFQKKVWCPSSLGAGWGGGCIDVARGNFSWILGFGHMTAQKSERTGNSPYLWCGVIQNPTKSIKK